MKKFTYYLKKLSGWLLPFTCILCGFASTRSQDLCMNCYQDLPWLFSFCKRCANRLPDNSNLICGYCLKEKPPFDATFSLFYYQPPITKVIMDLKFGHKLLNARILAELFIDKIQYEWYLNKPLPEVIIPIPLHDKRLKERGFNQALEIARPISKAFNLPLDLKSAIRIKHTMPQATLSGKLRVKNMRNAFFINKLNYKSVAVVDDVITTGNTMVEFCKMLKKGGVETVDVWCCARV